MELCSTTTRALSTPTLPHRSLPYTSHLTSLPLIKTTHFPGVVYRNKVKVLRATSSEEASEGSSRFGEERGDGDGVATLEDVPYVNNVKETVEEKESSSDEETAQPFQELLDNINIKLDSEDSYQIFLYGGGALVTVWLLSAIVGSIDSIPVLPKLLEVVGLGYSLWFTTRYLLFKKNREELTAKFEEIKREVLGSSDNDRLL